MFEQTTVRRMLGGIPEDVRSETGYLLVRSVPLDSTEVPTFVRRNFCEPRPRTLARALKIRQAFPKF